MRYLNRGRGNRRGRRRRLHEDEDPLSGVANLFDVAMVFALGLIVALIMVMDAQEVLTNPEELREIIEQGKMLQKSDVQVTVSGELKESVKGTLHDVEMGDETVTLFVPESGGG